MDVKQIILEALQLKSSETELTFPIAHSILKAFNYKRTGNVGEGRIEYKHIGSKYTVIVDKNNEKHTAAVGSQMLHGHKQWKSLKTDSMLFKYLKAWHPDTKNKWADIRKISKELTPEKK